MYTKTTKKLNWLGCGNNRKFGDTHFRKLSPSEIKKLHPTEKIAYFRQLSKNAKVGKKK